MNGMPTTPIRTARREPTLRCIRSWYCKPRSSLMVVRTTRDEGSGDLADAKDPLGPQRILPRPPPDPALPLELDLHAEAAEHAVEVQGGAGRPVLDVCPLQQDRHPSS